MDKSLRKADLNFNITKLLNGREVNVDFGKLLQQRTQFTESWINRLGLEYELKGHRGCVNCLEWSADGRHLVSGSDDTDIIIWDPFTHRLVTKIPTTHIGNIFSVKFLGNDSSLIASGAGDCRIIVQSVEQTIIPQTPHLDCNCHLGRVKRLATSRDEPSLFWSAGEDGIVIQYDLRESHECSKKNKVLIDLGCSLELKCITINPVKSHLVAVGANDCFVRLFDRRMIKTTDFTVTSQTARETRYKSGVQEQDPRCVQYYVPGHLLKDLNLETSYKLAVTYIAFDSSGSDMLVNMGGEQIYLFDIDNPRYASELQIPDSFKKRRKSAAYCPCCNKNRVIEISSNSDFKCNQHIANKPCACAYIERGQLIFQRKWSGDVYSAARDYLHVIKYWPDSKDAYIGLIQCLISLNWTDEAFNWLEFFKQQFPEVADTLEYKELHTDLIDYKSKKSKDDENSNVKESNGRESREKINPRDYESRFLGHCNTITDIKEANFLGKDGEFICAGSDDGILFIWNRKTTNIAKALMGDTSIVNCVQPHPTACFIATSGIDPVVKLWSPKPEEGSSNIHIVTNPWPAVEANQQRMTMDPFETMLANMGYRISPVDGQDSATCRTS